MCLLLSRSFLYQSFVRYFLRNPSVPRTPLHMSHHVSIELRKFVSKFGSSFRSSEVRFEVRKFAAKFPANFRTSKRIWELGNELRNRVLKSEQKSTIIVHEENTKKNHKRVVSVYVIQIHVDLHKL